MNNSKKENLSGARRSPASGGIAPGLAAGMLAHSQQQCSSPEISPAEDQREVPRQLMSIDESLGMLSHRVTALDLRLRPVLAADNPSEAPNPAVMSSDLGARLQTFRLGIESACDFLASLERRVQL